MSYDVYYATGGGPLVLGGADVWVNHWIDNIAPHLKVKPKLLIHRRRPILTKKQSVMFDKTLDKNEFHKSHVKLEKKASKIVENFHEKTEKYWKKPEKPEPLESVWQGDNPKEFEKVMKGARRVHILHGYYTPHKVIEDIKDNIHSAVFHVSVQLSLKASFDLRLKQLKHFAAYPQWEQSVAKWSKNNVWIGVSSDTPLHEDKGIINIPNFYEFKHNKELNDNPTIGFTARIESRKAPHFMDGHDSLSFTSPKDLDWWKGNCGHTFDKTKLFTYKSDNTERFFNRDDWGISHSAHIYEPFGYSIFQSVDYGKLPILSEDWCSDFEYPYRASTKERFDEIVNIIKKSTYEERNSHFRSLREYLSKYDNKEEWVEKYLRIYNG